MKKIICIFFIILMMLGCKEYDGKILADHEGNLYKLKHSVGDAYFIKPINDEIKIYNKFFPNQ